jgi:hypothetical protein
LSRYEKNVYLVTFPFLVAFQERGGEFIEGQGRELIERQGREFIKGQGVY